MSSQRKLKLVEAWRSLAPGQGFRFFAVATVLLAAAAMLGAVIAGSREQRNLERKDDHVAALVGGLTSSKSELERRFADLTVTQGELLQRHAAVEKSLGASRLERQALVGETEFLNRYIAYMGVRDARPGDGKPGDGRPADPKPLLDSLCVLWKSGDKQFVRFQTGPLELSQQDFDQGRLSPDLQTLLVENFISLDPLQQIRVADAAQAKAAKGARAPAPVRQLHERTSDGVGRPSGAIDQDPQIRHLPGRCPLRHSAQSRGRGADPPGMRSALTSGASLSRLGAARPARSSPVACRAPLA